MPVVRIGEDPFYRIFLREFMGILPGPTELYIRTEEMSRIQISIKTTVKSFKLKIL